MQCFKYECVWVWITDAFPSAHECLSIAVSATVDTLFGSLKWFQWHLWPTTIVHILSYVIKGYSLYNLSITSDILWTREIIISLSSKYKLYFINCTELIQFHTIYIYTFIQYHLLYVTNIIISCRMILNLNLEILYNIAKHTSKSQFK